MRTMTEDVRRYLSAVEVELSDLGAEDRRELLADVEEHLTEVAAEHEGPLEERLGPPAGYASELRSSAGFPARAGDAAPAPGRWRSTVDRWLADERVRKGRMFVVEIAPGWWLVRGYLFVMAYVALWGGGRLSDLPVPRIAGTRLFGLVAIALIAAGSYVLGRLGRRNRTAGALSGIATVVVVLMALATVGSVRAAPAIYHASAPPPPGVRHVDGTEALNLCPYGADGKLLSGVLLFDQAGRPLTSIPRMPSSPNDVQNAYPRDIRLPAADGVLRDAPCPGLATVKIATVDGPSWVQAMVGDIPVFTALLERGQTRTFYGPAIHLVIGNAGAVRIRANGKLLGKVGAMGEVYRGGFDASTETLPIPDDSALPGGGP